MVVTYQVGRLYFCVQLTDGLSIIALQNKDKEETEREKEEEKTIAAAMLARPSGARRGRPLGRAGPGGMAGRGAPRTPCSEGRSNGRGRAEAPSTVANGDSKTGRIERTQSWVGELNLPTASLSVVQTPPAGGPGGRRACTIQTGPPMVSSNSFSIYLTSCAIIRQ